MATREEILGKIRCALQIEKVRGASQNDTGLLVPPDPPALPDPPQVWAVRGASQDEILSEFSSNLKAASGNLVLCSDRADAVAKIAETLKTIELNSGVDGREKRFRLGVRDSELANSLLDSALPLLADLNLAVERAPEDPNTTSAAELESISASLVPAEFLLADTGSAVIRSSNAFNRLLTYLSPVCLIAAKKSLLREHLPHAWPEILDRIKGNTEAAGEFLLMTGPSRTADIEKILILGVHGPKKVFVFVIENE